MVMLEAPDKCRRCGGTNLKQDEDVLDTWFSSWLWPFATMGWPESTALQEKFYPTSTLVTAPDIIFFWVARMVFAGLEFKGVLPFKDVYFTSIVRDMQGRKMSKSLGNSPDPIEVMDKYGADALRYTIISLAPMGQDILFAEEKCELGRNFMNKIWNTARFTLMNTQGHKPVKPASDALTTEDIWILSRFNRTVKSINANLEAFRFNDALSEVYHFTWNELCDWYVEFIKPRLTEEAPAQTRNSALYVLTEILEGTLKLLHPFTPFITEEIFQVLKSEGLTSETATHLIKAKWPCVDQSRLNDAIEAKVAFAQEVVAAIRNLRAEKNIPPAKKGQVVTFVEDTVKRQNLLDMEQAIQTLSKTEKLDILAQGEKPATSASTVIPGAAIYLNLEGLVDKSAEREKIKKEIEKSEGFLISVQKKLNNESFIKSAPPEVVEKERVKMDTTREKIQKLKENLKLFE